MRLEEVGESVFRGEARLLKADGSRMIAPAFSTRLLAYYPRTMSRDMHLDVYMLDIPTETHPLVKEGDFCFVAMPFADKYSELMFLLKIIVRGRLG